MARSAAPMPVTGLFFLPLDPNTPSPAATLTSHVSRKLSARPLPAFWLDYRLLVDTSSLLPRADAAKRHVTQIMTFSHVPNKTYVATSSDAGEAMALIAIPGGSVAGDFFSTVTNKLQPMWANRQEFRIDRGAAIELNEGELTVRIGELRMTSGQGSGRIRGTIIQVDMRADDDDEGDETAVDWVVREKLLRALFEATFRDCNVGFDNLQLVCRLFPRQTAEPREFQIVKLFFGLLQFRRPDRGI